MQKEKREIKEFILKIGNPEYLPHPLQLLVSFEDMDDYWFIESKKLKFKFSSTNKNIEQSKNDFSQLVTEYLEYLFNKGKILSKLESLGFKLMPEQFAMMQFNTESRQKKLLKELPKSSLKAVNHIDLFANLVTDWQVSNSKSEIIV
ncbi:MAG: hypothetical protein ACRC1F_00535 [Metamycoplasmataceae bacterium]